MKILLFFTISLVTVLLAYFIFSIIKSENNKIEQVDQVSEMKKSEYTIMSLGWVIEYLKKIPDPDNTKVFVLERQEKADKERKEIPILDIFADESDRELILLISQDPAGTICSKNIVTVKDLSNLLGEFPEKYLEYRVLTGKWIVLDEDYTACCDYPIDGIGHKEDDLTIAFVERQ